MIRHFSLLEALFSGLDVPETKNCNINDEVSSKGQKQVSTIFFRVHLCNFLHFPPESASYATYCTIICSMFRAYLLKSSYSHIISSIYHTWNLSSFNIEKPSYKIVSTSKYSKYKIKRSAIKLLSIGKLPMISLCISVPNSIHCCLWCGSSICNWTMNKTNNQYRIHE